ncbi:hypothetical protein EPI10_017360 [Gossypium australe]|uniref:Uncharacterized protein n=1 Tax=Gossypium australe TaxID=47621 RepID=A0A5B6VQV6_9ROSI|nr:hypothetical protein EPI10_017360 [Gossypium australe]
MGFFFSSGDTSATVVHLTDSRPILLRCIQDFQVFGERARTMLQWMGGSRRKVMITHSFTQRQRQYFEQRKQQEKTTGYEGHADETSIAGRHQKECRSLDILSLLNLSTFSAVGKCYPSKSHCKSGPSTIKYQMPEDPAKIITSSVPPSYSVKIKEAGIR